MYDIFKINKTQILIEPTLKDPRLDRLNKPYTIFTDYVEREALNQFISVMELDCVIQGALMPDVHTGYTLPIGGVVAVQDKIFPSFIGYDIGCGVSALMLPFDFDTVDNKKHLILEEIYNTIPVGFKHHDFKVCDYKFNFNKTSVLAHDLYMSTGMEQIGTLGSGNHFIEIGFDTNFKIWIIVHSGSRKLGHSIASHYMKLASNSDKPKEGLYSFDAKSELGELYINDMNFLISLSAVNRIELILSSIKCMEKHCGKIKFDMENLIDCNHNHAELKDGLWIHRKGATHADVDMLGIIPGNMHDGCYIVSGLGYKPALYSSSHGAGRVMSRSKAKENINLEEFKTLMNHIACKANESTLDESPWAYKNIYDVLKLQQNMIKIKNHILPIINIKGV